MYQCTSAETTYPRGIPNLCRNSAGTRPLHHITRSSHGDTIERCFLSACNSIDVIPSMLSSIWGGGGEGGSEAEMIESGQQKNAPTVNCDCFIVPMQTFPRKQTTRSNYWSSCAGDGDVGLPSTSMEEDPLTIAAKASADSKGGAFVLSGEGGPTRSLMICGLSGNPSGPAGPSAHFLYLLQRSQMNSASSPPGGRFWHLRCCQTSHESQAMISVPSS
jgi:hypothetical protein